LPVPQSGGGVGPQQGEETPVARAVIERRLVQPGEQRRERFRFRLHRPSLALECERGGGYYGGCRSPTYSVLRLVTFRRPKHLGYGALSRLRPSSCPSGSGSLTAYPLQDSDHLSKSPTFVGIISRSLRQPFSLEISSCLAEIGIVLPFSNMFIYKTCKYINMITC
jgi:hypothetical protein